jgi:hypothetical protein
MVKLQANHKKNIYLIKSVFSWEKKNVRVRRAQNKSTTNIVSLERGGDDVLSVEVVEMLFFMAWHTKVYKLVTVE